jgi:MinD-like ATPase involved in chromosome partitioning or flagellar assembly
MLFLIECHTAHMVGQSRQAMERFLTDEALGERELPFLEAFALGRAPPIRPTIQDLERFASQWAPLVPENPRLRAALARVLSQKYLLDNQMVPGIRAALALGDEAVQEAYRILCGEPLAGIFAARATLIERLRWAWVALTRWLESLPPFWTAFALTFTETVGLGILALPIAVASLGPLPGVALLIILGFINVLTIAALAEACARSGTVRYGNAFFGRLVAEYLGPIGSIMVTLGLMILCFLVLVGYYIGLSTTLAVTIARQGRRVSIIDTDIQSPGIHVLFGLDEEKIDRALNDYLWGRCAIEETAYDVGATLKIEQGEVALMGRSFYLIPSSIKVGEIARVLREGYDVGRLNDGFRDLVNRLKLDYLFIDTHPGLNEETLLSIAISDVLVIILRPDSQDFQGTAVTVDVARKLDVPRLLLVVNKVLATFDLAAIKQKVETIYKAPVAGILILNEEMVRLASSDIFCLRFPNHPFTQSIQEIAQQVMA